MRIGQEWAIDATREPNGRVQLSLGRQWPHRSSTGRREAYDLAQRIPLRFTSWAEELLVAR